MAFYQRLQRDPLLNVTAFIDVLLLLVIFLVICFSLQKGIVEQMVIQLPAAHAASGTAPLSNESIHLFIDEVGHYRLKDQPLNAPDYQGLKRLLGEQIQAGDKVAVFGDERAPYRSLVFLLEAIQSLGIKSIEIKMSGGKRDSRS